MNPMTRFTNAEHKGGEGEEEGLPQQGVSGTRALCPSKRTLQRLIHSGRIQTVSVPKVGC